VAGRLPDVSVHQRRLSVASAAVWCNATRQNARKFVGGRRRAGAPDESEVANRRNLLLHEVWSWHGIAV
jgi:hypothetical protein